MLWELLQEQFNILATLESTLNTGGSDLFSEQAVQTALNDVANSGDKPSPVFRQTLSSHNGIASQGQRA